MLFWSSYTFSLVLNEYYLFLKGNESDIMASMKTIRQL